MNRSPDHDLYLLSEFKKALRRYAHEPVLNLDEKFPHKFELFVQAHEMIIDKVGERIPPNKWSYYRLGLITEGCADYVCGIYKFKAKKNTLVIIPPRVLNSSEWHPDTKGYVVLFNLDFFTQSQFPYRYIQNKRILQPTVLPYVDLTDDQAKKLERVFKTIAREKNKDGPHQNEFIAIKIIELLIRCERLYSDSEDVNRNQVTLDITQKFADLVELNFAKERSVTFYASQLHIHPNYLNALVKAHTGLTAKESIQNRILLETKYLLHTTDLSIKQISNEMGFGDPTYFNVFFKRSENISPAAYRASII
jgi:AraC family transcriptional regulator, transcriptional activator of pobA